MTIENLTNPGVDPVDGDLIRKTYPNGFTEKKEYHAPVDPGPAPLPFTASAKSLIDRRIQKLLKQGKTNAALQLINKE
jgi:hypothetical protein